MPLLFLTFSLWSLLASPLVAGILAPLKGLTELIQLDLKGTNVSDASLECLKGFNRLGVLHVEKSRMSEEGVTKLKQSLPDCNIWIKE